VCAYLREYAIHFDLPVLSRTRIEKIERDGEVFRVIDDRGQVRSGRAVIAATGSFGNPSLPEVPGRSDYRGRVLHAAEYRSPEPFRGQRVVVVGGGNSAAHISSEIATVARVTLARRREIRFVPQRLFGRSLYFWLRITGLDRSRLLTGKHAVVIDHGEYRDAMLCDAPNERPMFQCFTADGVQWPDGSRERVDSVLFATGYKPCLRYLDGWPVCNADGCVQQRDGACTTVDGLYFVGLTDQTCFASASLRGVGRDAEVVVRAIAERCGSAKRLSGAPVA
jgi:putative flavoprotein involved in K+ transport